MALFLLKYSIFFCAARIKRSKQKLSSDISGTTTASPTEWAYDR